MQMLLATMSWTDEQRHYVRSNLSSQAADSLKPN